MPLSIVKLTPLRRGCIALALAGIFLWLGGCATTGDESEQWSAEELYKEAHDALEANDFEAAIKHFETLEAKYPFGPYAEQVQLDTAYAYYRFEEPDSAIAAADRFIKLHPRHPKVDYAYYLRGLAAGSKKKHPLNFLMPQDPSERDPGSAQRAFDYFKELVTRFPDSIYAPDAVERMKKLRLDLAYHEVHVAQYYLKRHAFVAAANRATYILETFPQTPPTHEALEILVKAYEGLGMDDLAADSRRVLELNFPAKPSAPDSDADS